MTKKNILMVAGEPSADRHASQVIREVQTLWGDIAVFGMGGPAMESSGMECVYSMDELSVMGFSDVIPKMGRILKVYRGLTHLMKQRNPDIVVLLDLPDFNMRIARRAHAHGFRTLYYIAPQAWAWRRSRAEHLSRITNGLAVIFPFEEDFFRSFGVNARYVGHPIMESVREMAEVSWPPKRIALLPGSRSHEISQILPVMLEAKRIVGEQHPEISWLLPVAPGLEPGDIEKLVDDDIELTGELPEIDLAMVKSGTSTLELAVRGIPEIICYRTSRINYCIASSFVKIPHIGMPNIISGKRIVPELIQHEFTGTRLAEFLLRFIQDRSLFCQTRNAFSHMRDLLGTKKASQGVAQWICEMLH
ncbi:MAG: lipid-A-disaccharide synthase [Desulfomonilia bacterium]|nr:lipid-A-disaccharide synthase [Desulfomonilia bacterium]